jgi:hypothetical protein
LSGLRESLLAAARGFCRRQLAISQLDRAENVEKHAG